MMVEKQVQNMVRKILLPFVFSVIFSSVVQSQQDSIFSSKNQISVGIGKSNITPSVQVMNWVTGKPYGFVHDSIYVRALVLQMADVTSVIINWELVDAGDAATAEVRRKIAEGLQIPKKNILINASHNHSAPWSPVYQEGLRGSEKDTWWAVRYMPAQYENPAYLSWMQTLVDQTILAVRTAMTRLQPCTVWLGRTDIGALVQNRRPRPAHQGIVRSKLPEKYNYEHEDWDPKVLGEGMDFGEVDRALTLVSFRDSLDKPFATIMHMSAHAVSIYPYLDGVSADWPGATITLLEKRLGGHAIFLQGTAGDINPAYRGEDAVVTMAQTIAGQIEIANTYAAQLSIDSLHNAHSAVGLPLTDYGKTSTDLETMPAEIQLITLGPLAIISLPGEPMTGIGLAIKRRSPYPQTLVLGYSNGKGCLYIGLPGEKALGGYESGEKTSIGTDNAGQILVETAVQLLLDSAK